MQKVLKTLMIVGCVGAWFALTLPTQAQLFSNRTMINGAGATFPYPIYSKWFSEYGKIHSQVAFNYQSIGSGGGVRQLMDETIEFAGSDNFLSDEQIKKLKKPVFHFPTVMGAVVLTYSLPGFEEPLKLTPALLVDIFLGKISKWSDRRILEHNPGLQSALEKNKVTDILIVRRSDGSGTTAVFSEYLSKISEEWKNKVGKGTALRWPVGIGGKGNEGVTSFVKQIPGSIGYVELVFAKTLKLKYAYLQNQLGEFVEPSLATVTAAADGMAKQIPEDFRVSLTNVNAKHAYPLSSFTFILVYQSTPKSIAVEIKKFLKWALSAGQAIAQQMHYAPLPKAVVERVNFQVDKIVEAQE